MGWAEGRGSVKKEIGQLRKKEGHRRSRKEDLEGAMVVKRRFYKLKKGEVLRKSCRRKGSGSRSGDKK